MSITGFPEKIIVRLILKGQHSYVFPPFLWEGDLIRESLSKGPRVWGARLAWDLYTEVY